MTNITSATVYFTSLCNSGCQTCDIWMNKTRTEFPLEEFIRISCLPMMKNAVWTLIGGEFTVYSKYQEVVQHLNDIGAEYYFITNGILPDRVKKVYDKTTIKNLSFSLDAVGDRHDTIRGAKGNYNKIIETIQWVKQNHPETRVRIGYTVSHFNTRKDLQEVLTVARWLGVDVKISMASESEVLLSHKPSTDPVIENKEFYEFEDLVPLDNYLELYRPWARGFSPECLGIEEHVTLNYDGGLLLCENLYITMGNVLETPLEELWVSPSVVETRENFHNCSKCWMSCVRKADAKRFTETAVANIKASFRYL